MHSIPHTLCGVSPHLHRPGAAAPPSAPLGAPPSAAPAAPPPRCPAPRPRWQCLAAAPRPPGPPAAPAARPAWTPASGWGPAPAGSAAPRRRGCINQSWECEGRCAAACPNCARGADRIQALRHCCIAPPAALTSSPATAGCPGRRGDPVLKSRAGFAAVEGFCRPAGHQRLQAAWLRRETWRRTAVRVQAAGAAAGWAEAPGGGPCKSTSLLVLVIKLRDVDKARL